MRNKYALGRAHQIYSNVPYYKVNKDLSKALDSLQGQLIKCLESELDKLSREKALKFILKAKCMMGKYSFEKEKNIQVECWFSSQTHSLITKRNVHKNLEEAKDKLLARFDSFNKEGSGWSLNKVSFITLTTDRFRLFQGGCRNISLPKEIQRYRGIISINQNEANSCFLNAIAAAIAKKKKNPSRQCQLYKSLVDILPAEFLHFPVNLKQIQLFEEKTPISVNIYGYDKVFFPYYVTEKEAKYHADLLLYKNHYFAIKNLSTLLVGQNRVNKRKTYICKFCLSYFLCKEKYQFHERLCLRNMQQYHIPLLKDCQIKFKNYKNIITAPFVIYSDFEACIRPKQILAKGKTLSKKMHEPISFAAMIVCKPNDYFSKPPVIYTGIDCVQQFFKYLEREFAYITHVVKNINIPIDMSPEDKIAFAKSTHCAICHRSFQESLKVRDHCHLSGRYRQALCSRCNLTYASQQENVYVIMHGLTNYDSHFIIHQFANYQDTKIKVIPRTSEKYLSFSLGNLHFKDSFQFMNESLSTLVSNLKTKGKQAFSKVNQYITNEEQRNLFYSKGFFPYNYISDISILKEKQLPPIESFYNDLNRQVLSEKDYAFAQKAWNAFSCKTLKDYLHVYLLADCLLLADCFENFRNNCIKDYELDPIHYFSNAHFTFDAFLKKSKITLELLHEMNQYLFVSKGIRGGMSILPKRYSKANNPYMLNYNPHKEHVYIMDFDSNNLYGYSMMDYLPYKDFEWLSPNKISLKTILATPPHSNKGYILECTLYYPKYLHNDHQDYPVAPEKVAIPYNELSPYSQQICDMHNLKGGIGQEKLMATLHAKKDYILHYRNLQLYVRLGLKVGKISTILMFTQGPIIKDYIQFNSEKRAAATNNFDNTYYKFLCNSLFGKTMERPDNRTRVKLVNNIKSYEKYVSHLTFKSSKMINSNLVGLQLKYATLKLNKPYYLGMAILELSKYHMFNFHYNVMKKRYGTNIQLLYTDTDSLIYEIKTKDIYNDLGKMPGNHFDFSNYPVNHPLYSTKNKKVPGLFKDESKGQQIIEFVGLRSKMYAFRLEEQKDKNIFEMKVAKGIKKTVIHQDLKFQHYFTCNFENKQMEHDFKTIRSTGHQLYTSHQSKVSLSPFDDKRWLVNNIDTLPHGHYKTRRRK